jgi:glycosyltransferase involved in cell wall biosynthesis
MASLPLKSLRALHQFSPNVAVGDGVTNGAFFTRRLLRELGFESEIYCDHVPPALTGQVLPRDALARDPDSWLLVHHALGYLDDSWLADFAGRSVMIYHNITPEALLPADGPWRQLSRLGREQLRNWRPWMAGAIGDSALNSEELLEAGYSNAVTIPMLVDLHRIETEPWDPALLARYRNAHNILFVGRLAPNKRHDLLLRAFAEYLHFTDQPANLILPGAPISREFLLELQNLAEQLGIPRHVDFLGPVPDTALRCLYRVADLYVSTSDHEGFGMPLIEAAVFDVPVIARATSSVPATLGQGGLLLEDEDPRELGAVMHMLVSEPALRRKVLAGQQANLHRFDPAPLRLQLAEYLQSLGIRVPRPPANLPEHQPRWRIEGPFDSSYSLAVVNRETARALMRAQQRVGLSITPGAGEPEPDSQFLAGNPDVAALARDAQLPGRTDVAMRFTYPPTTQAFSARVRVVHGYGWEETGFPVNYIDGFNRKLDLVTVLSSEVAKILRDAGLRLPIAVVGAGVDQLLSQPRTELPLQLRKGYRFLHVSSCFPRKGVDALLAAYGQAFRAEDDVCLVIKTFANPHNTAIDQLAQLRRQDPRFPDVQIIEADWTDAQLAELYRNCNAFVAPSRGEGLGLPIAEAMAFGLPVITTAWGGQTDFCTAETAWLVDFKFAQAKTHLQVEHSAWAEPDVADLAARLREVHVCEPAELALRVQAARARVAQEYTWDRVAQKTRAAVAALEQMPMLQRRPRVGWVSSWNTRCGVASYSAQLVQAFEPGRLQILASRTGDLLGPDASNVLRAWDQGVFDDHDLPSQALDALELDALPLLVDNTEIDALVIQYNFGFFSPEQLARVIDRAKARAMQVHVFMHATRDVKKADFQVSLSVAVNALARADRLYVHGLEDLNRMRAFGLTANTVLFPHGIPQPSQPALPVPEAAGLMQGRRVIASYGFMLPHKGLPELLQAFELLDPKANNLHLLLCCALYPAQVSEDLRDQLHAQLVSHGLEERVTLITDYLSDDQSFAWLQQADLLVFPYQHTAESSSAAVRMGLASGKSVAVTPLAIFDDVGGCVHRLPGTTPKELADGIRELLTDRGLLESTLPAAARHVQARAWPQLSLRLVNIIDGIANPLPEIQ